MTKKNKTFSQNIPNIVAILLTIAGIFSIVGSPRFDIFRGKVYGYVILIAFYGIAIFGISKIVSFLNKTQVSQTPVPQTTDPFFDGDATK